MTEALIHRGPDSEGVWVSESQLVSLGHRRLEIIDPTPAGSQPMSSVGNRWTIVYNGEIYNTDELRSLLGRRHYSSASDTEVLLTCIDRFGVAKTLRILSGMFAFAAWDDREQNLWIARDRFGEKPLYYAWHNDDLLFASEIKAFFAVDSFRPAIDRTRLAQLLRFGYVPGDHTIYKGVYRLPPAHCARVDRTTPSSRLCSRGYWDPIAEALAGAGDRKPRGNDSVDELEDLLTSIVSSRMISDVPLGAFLSGGIDSSTIVALMRRATGESVRTFTIGFEEAAYDESVEARKIANYLETNHTEVVFTASDARRVIPRLAGINCDSFADAAQINHLMVSDFASQHVKVCLSGDGGDELFGGYHRYQRYRLLRRVQRFVPKGLRMVALRSAPLGTRRLSSVVGDTRHLYCNLMSVNRDAEDLVAGIDASVDACAPYFPSPETEILAPEEQAMLLDTVTYLPDNILTSLDRSSMAVGLEVRSPFLDPKLLCFAWGLHRSDRLHGRDGKWVLRQLAHRLLPADVAGRRKTGFGVPMGEWLRGPLRTWADDLLDETLMREQDYLVPTAVRSLWQTHLAGIGDRAGELWPILMFQSWLNEWS